MPSNLNLDIHPKDLKGTQIDIHTPMFMAALFIQPKGGNNLCPLRQEWINKCDAYI